MKTDMELFANEILGLSSRFTSFWAGGIPGTSIATSNSATAGTDVTTQLKFATAEFAGMYNKPGTSRTSLEVQAKKIEASLMMAQTLNIISPEKADKLIDDLYKLMET